MEGRLKFKSENSGFTLIEMVIFMAIVTSVGLMIAHFSGSAQIIFYSMQRTALATEAFEQIRLTLNNPRACTKNFSTVGTFNISTPANLTRIFNYNPATDTLSDPVVDVSAAPTLGLKILEIKLVPILQMTDTLIISDLKIRFSKNVGNSAQEISRTLPLFSRVQNDKIQECWLKKDFSSIEFNNMCLSISNGALDYFDPATQQCTLLNGVWVPGTSFKAVCPADMKLPAKATSSANCKNTSVVDPNLGQAMSFVDGGGSVTGSGTYRRAYVRTHLDISSRTCTCDWATDLSAATINSATCSILCLKP